MRDRGRWVQEVVCSLPLPILTSFNALNHQMIAAGQPELDIVAFARAFQDPFVAPEPPS